jgi:nitrogen fixation protein FixH
MIRRSERQPRIVTGRTVLICFLAFFGIVGAMNAVLIRAATSTFGGVDTENAYKAGLNFGHDIAAAAAQDALHWQVAGTVRLDANNAAVAELSVKDAGGRALAGLAVSGRLAHPANRNLDRTFAMEQTAPGRYRGIVNAAPGQWDFIVEIDRQSERAFQSRTRVYLK